MALLTWESDALDARHPSGISHLTNGVIHAALKRFDGRKSRDIKRQDRLAGIRWRLVVFVEINQVAPERGAVQGPGKQTEDQSEAITFVAADGKEEALFSSPRVSQGPAERV